MGRRGRRRRAGRRRGAGAVGPRRALLIWISRHPRLRHRLAEVVVGRRHGQGHDAAQHREEQHGGTGQHRRREVRRQCLAHRLQLLGADIGRRGRRAHHGRVQQHVAVEHRAAAAAQQGQRRHDPGHDPGRALAGEVEAGEHGEAQGHQKVRRPAAAEERRGEHGARPLVRGALADGLDRPPGRSDDAELRDSDRDQRTRRNEHQRSADADARRPRRSDRLYRIGHGHPPVLVAGATRTRYRPAPPPTAGA